MSLEEKIFLVLKNEKRQGISFDALLKKVGLSKEKADILKRILLEHLSSGKIVEKNSKFILARNLGLFPATIVSLHTNFGFCALENGDEIFVPGRDMMGSMPGDLVLIKINHLKNKSREAVVKEIINKSDVVLSGDVVFKNSVPFFAPDGKIKIPFEIVQKKGVFVREGDKVLVKILRRGRRHFDYKAVIIQVFGKANKADVCANAIIAQSGAPTHFSSEVLNEAKAVSECEIHPKEISSRLDLRKETIFTIDSHDTKDIDDAISIRKTKNGYVLGVHIADVSFFVKENSFLDKEALLRGTSIYYASEVIPMLPKELSNGICSLNEGEDRLSFSVIMNLDNGGNLVSYELKKSVINSRIKGVYKEINSILNGTAEREIKAKYKCVLKEIKLMKELSDILSKKREQRGSLDIYSVESKILLDENQNVLSISKRESGESEKIIEEFMLLANETVATFAIKNNLPFIYRVHELPDSEKIHSLSLALRTLGIDSKNIQNGVSNQKLAEILESAKGTKYHTLINNLVLRSLAKAKYSDKNLGHFGLVLNNYAHFTSPIRRYPDLAIHRILSSVISGMGEKKVHTRYDSFVKSAAVSSSVCEARAVKIERDCEDSYKAEYMSNKISEKFEGEISSVTSHGIYVSLENTIEGMVSIDDLPAGEYYISENVKVTNLTTKKTYCVGDKVKVLVTGANVSKGTIDFKFI